MKQINTKKKSRLVAWIFALGMGGAVIALSMFLWQYNFNGDNSKTATDSYSQYYMMVVDDGKSAFWQSVYQGAYERGLQEGVYVELLGDNLTKEYSKEELMQIAISSNADGIIVSADESQNMTTLINEANEREIPVVTVYGDNTQSGRCSFVGVGSYNLGREYGRQVLRTLENYDEETLPETVQVAVLVNAHVMDVGQNILCAGIQDTIEQEKQQDMEVVVSLVSVDDTNSFSVEESIRDIFISTELPEIIVCLNELNTTCVCQAIVDYNKVGQVAIIGYYDSETILNAIDRNVVDATISVDTYQMGEYCVQALQEYNEFGTTSQYFTVDVTLINKQNVSEYLEGGEQDEN